MEDIKCMVQDAGYSKSQGSEARDQGTGIGRNTNTEN